MDSRCQRELSQHRQFAVIPGGALVQNHDITIRCAAKHVSGLDELRLEALVITVGANQPRHSISSLLGNPEHFLVNRDATSGAENDDDLQYHSRKRSQLQNRRKMCRPWAKINQSSQSNTATERRDGVSKYLGSGSR